MTLSVAENRAEQSRFDSILRVKIALGAAMQRTI
jgi:hypothetical protein